MPFDLVGDLIGDLTGHTSEVAEDTLGVPRALLAERAMEGVPPALRPLVAGLRFTAGGRLLHMGMVFDTVAWRVTWDRPGMPELSGAIPVWNGAPA